MSHLVIDGLRKRFDDNTVVDGVDLSIADGESIVLLGPSGCGKTTCLRMIAGFERPDGGTIRLGGRTLVGPRTFVPPERRRMSVVFQSYALWPHLSVRENVGYGPTTAKASRADTRRRVDEALDMVQLGGLSDRYAHQLSGGQQQRVALARALVNDPALLLLDEPLSNLDTRLREDMRLEVKRIQRSLGITMVYVTHDQAEALSLADRLVVMHGGQVAQIGTPEEVYRHPTTGFVARSLGPTNILTGCVTALRADQQVEVAVPGLRTPLSVHSPACARAVGDRVAVSARPVDLRLERTAEADCTVSEALFFGDHVQYTVEVPGQPSAVKVTGPSRDRFTRGDRVGLGADGAAASLLSDPPAAPTTGRVSSDLPVPVPTDVPSVSVVP